MSTSTTRDEAQEMLSSGSVIENLGSYIPPIRQNHIANRFEIGVQNRVARTLYDKRVGIAQHIAADTSIDCKKVTYSALVANGISPHSVDRYEDYVQLLVDRQGDWQSFRAQLDSDLNTVQYARDTTRNYLLSLIMMMLFVLAIGGLIYRYFPDQTYLSMIPASLTVAVVAYAMVFMWKDLQFLSTIRSERIGKKSKNTDNFIPYDAVL